jgi:hypothetical protein
MLLIILFKQIQTKKYINCISKCNILYLYFRHVHLLIIMYIHIQNLKYINCIINCNIVPYSYFPPVLSLHILYIQLQTVKYNNYPSMNNSQYTGLRNLTTFLFCTFLISCSLLNRANNCCVKQTAAYRQLTGSENERVVQCVDVRNQLNCPKTTLSDTHKHTHKHTHTHTYTPTHTHTLQHPVSDNSVHCADFLIHFMTFITEYKCVTIYTM